MPRKVISKQKNITKWILY